MVKILSVRQFNAEADARYREHVSKFEFGKGGFPYRPMYVFKTPEGNDRKRGFVVCDGNSYHFCLTKKSLEQELSLHKEVLK